MRALLLLPLLLVGCTSMPATVRELAKDPATVYSAINTPWGTSRFIRSGQARANVKIDPDGSVVIVACE